MTGAEFKDFPVSFGEARALRDDDCSRWTPREMLIYFLREIDNDRFNPDGLVVCYFRRDGGAVVTGMRRAQTTQMETVALIEMTKADLLSG